MLYQYSFTFNELAITETQLEQAMGYAPNTIPEPFPEIIREVLDRGTELCELTGGYIIIPAVAFLKENKQLKLNETLFDIKKVVYQQIKAADKVALFVCTAGPKIGNWSHQLMNAGDLMKGYVADMLGTVAVEIAMDKVQDELRTKSEKASLKITNRYSPGYCGWEVTEQQKLFSFFPEKFCGVSLSDTSLMHPIKSVSGVIGIGPNVSFNPYTCGMCELSTCLYRNLRKK